MTLRSPPGPRRTEPVRRRSSVSQFVVVAAIAAAVYAGLSFLGTRLPDSVEPAFRVGVLRWVLVGLAVLAAATAGVIDVRRRSTTDAFESERQRGEELEKRGQDLVALAEANRGLNRASPEKIMDSVASGAAVTVGAVNAATYTLDEEHEKMIPAGWTMAQKPDEQTMDSLAGRTAITRQPILSNDPPPSTVTAPIITGGELAGVVVAWAQGKRFGDRELRLLANYATDASVAISRARALDQERRIGERLVEIDRAKTDFVAAVTHELKTPLTSMLGYASILRKRVDALPKERREQFFEIIQRQGERILKLIGELLDSSRMESGLSRTIREPVDVTEIVKLVVAGMKPATRRHTIEVVLPDADPGLYGDPAAFEHVVTNLLDNAVKYSPKRTVIRIAVDVQPTELRLKVIDQGYGIAPEDLPHIFERFRQGEGADPSPQSVGLGLFIVRSLVEAQGGTVSCDSLLGKGSVFTVTYPRRAPRDVTAPQRVDITGGEAPEPETTSEPVQAEIPEPLVREEPPASVDAQTLRAIAQQRESTDKR